MYVCFIEKPDWSEFKKKKKELRKTRKEHKCTIYNLIEKSKKLWEKVRRSDCPIEQREKLTLEIHNLLRDNLHKVGTDNITCPMITEFSASCICWM
jgi:pumilio family protein 6